jgi:hypothetical protein
MGMVPQEGAHRHQNPGRAETTLETVALAEGGLDGMERLSVRGQALHGGDLSPVGLDREDEAGAHRLAVEQHGARSAHPVLAPYMRAGETELMAQEVAQEETRLLPAVVTSPVDGDVQPDG